MIQLDQPEASQLTGLKALNEIIRAYKVSIGEEHKLLVQICQQFFPQLEQLMGHYSSVQGNANQFKFMTIIAKIFCNSNTQSLLPFLGEPGKLDPWVAIITQVLTSSPGDGSPLIQLTTDTSTIEQLDSDDWWKLKAACAKVAIKLFHK